MNGGVSEIYCGGFSMDHLAVQKKIVLNGENGRISGGDLNRSSSPAIGEPSVTKAVITSFEGRVCLINKPLDRVSLTSVCVRRVSVP